MGFNRYQTRIFLSLFRSISMSPSKHARYTFPRTLIEFGYNFDERGELKKLDKVTGDVSSSPFEFHVKDNDDVYNQKHYEALGETITEYVYDLLTKEGLTKVPLPDAEQDIKSFVFATPDYEQADKLMILIHGSGVVRAGQWARSIIINKDLQSGTQLSYIRHARGDGYGVIVMNTNDNLRNGVRIPGSERPEKHAETVWQQCVRSSVARHIAIVAHSYGGVVTSHLASQFEWDFLNRVFAIGFTDSVHSSLQSDLPSKLYSHVLKISRNWVSSEQPLDSLLEQSTSSDDVPRVSAGTAKHELTSWTAYRSVFKFVEEQLAKRLEKVEL
uniref:UPF0528 protein CG10038 n=1 Tax=Cacopsylla melanoneura TaxID=428564 RepID=A0A8D8LZ81_9HEMI